MKQPPQTQLPTPTPFPLTLHAPRPSEARLRANRLNAKKSTGPRTPEGKARSSRNALKSGLIARCGPLFDDAPPEDAALLAKCIDELRETCRPVHPHQEPLIQRAALCQVRMARAARLETLWAQERRRELREAAQREADRQCADLDRLIADAERAGRRVVVNLLRAHRDLVDSALRSRLENAELLGALPAPDRTEALIRFERAATRALRRIVLQLEGSD